MTRYGYTIDQDERGSFRARVVDTVGTTVFTVLAGDALGVDDTSLVDDGFMRHLNDLAGLTDYLRSMGTLPADSEILTEAEFEAQCADADAASRPAIVTTYTQPDIDRIGLRLAEVLGVREPRHLGNGAPSMGVERGVISALEAAQYSHARGFRNVDLTGATANVDALRPDPSTAQALLWDEATDSGFMIRCEDDEAFKAEEWMNGDIVDTHYGTYADVIEWTESEKNPHLVRRHESLDAPTL